MVISDSVHSSITHVDVVQRQVLSFFTRAIRVRFPSSTLCAPTRRSPTRKNIWFNSRRIPSGIRRRRYGTLLVRELQNRGFCTRARRTFPRQRRRSRCWCTVAAHIRGSDGSIPSTATICSVGVVQRSVLPPLERTTRVRFPSPIPSATTRRSPTRNAGNGTSLGMKPPRGFDTRMRELFHSLDAVPRVRR